MKIQNNIILIAVAMVWFLAASCSKSESYSSLLRTEEKSVNKYLAQQKVEIEIPADGVFQYGEDAPYYKMDEDGSVYMKVIDPGNMDVRAQKGDRVYFLCAYKNLNYWAENENIEWVGNTSDLNGPLADTSFIYENTVLPSSTQYGTGIQLPMKYVGNESEVYLILKAASGFAKEQSSCTPYVFHVKYFKAEY